VHSGLVDLQNKADDFADLHALLSEFEFDADANEEEFMGASEQQQTI